MSLDVPRPDRHLEAKRPAAAAPTRGPVAICLTIGRGTPYPRRGQTVSRLLQNLVEGHRGSHRLEFGPGTIKRPPTRLGMTESPQRWTTVVTSSCAGTRKPIR